MSQDLFPNKNRKPFLNTDSVEQRFLKTNEIANRQGWILKEFQSNISMAIYSCTDAVTKFESKINVYFTTMSVTTYILHPKKGKGQLYRKNITYDQLERIFKNPRQHTGKGYYTKK